jgi:cobalt-zinc-cadmium efflux system membrane fusion protein
MTAATHLLRTSPSLFAGARPIMSLPACLRLSSLALLLVLASCGKPEVSTAPVTAAPDPNTVLLGESLQKIVRTGVVGSAEVSDSLRVAGQVGLDENHVAKIGATVTGRVIDVKATVGQQVRSGQTLAVLNSTELGAAQLAYKKARAQAQLNERNVERARQLFAADVIGSAELQRRESELDVARAEQQAAADQLRVLGVSLDDMQALHAQGSINSISPVVATISGSVIERKVTQGQVVQPSDALFSIADLSRVWVVAEVPEQQAAKVRVGQSVEIEIPALAARRIAKLNYVADTVDPQTRTITVRSELDNRDRLLKPAMLATFLIESGPVAQLVVPVGAVVRENDADYVFVEVSAGRFKLLETKLAAARGGMRPVVSGLQNGQKIVVEGAFHMNNERKRKELE